MQNIDLEGEQLNAFMKCVEHLTNKQDENKFLIFAAFAGCGKTYTLRKAIRYVESYGLNIATVAFTGRAASQLSDEGVVATTAHSLMYKPRFDQHGNLDGWIEKDGREILEVCGHGVVVDEASMFPKNMHDRLEELNIPIIYAGDFGQLPPVDTENPDFNCMFNVEGEVVTLVENHRFDVTNGIGFITNHLRENNSFPRVKKDALNYVRKNAALTEKFHRENQYDIVLCGTNKTRRRLNATIRAARGYTDFIPEVGETVICLRNSILADGRRINNGDLFTVSGVIPGETESVYMLEDSNGKMCSVRVLNSCWEEEKSPMTRGDKALFCFGYGYAISVHKSQGSTFKSVLFFDEDVSYFLDQQKFRYTGTSRAAERLDVAI